MKSTLFGRYNVLALSALAGALVALLPAGGTALAQDGTTTAVAELRTGEGEPVGTAQFVQTPEGVEIGVRITGNVPPGEHGLHIHERGDLSRSDFESAGDHFNPTGAEHGFDNPDGPHAGDLENITVAGDGTASYLYVNDRVTLSGGENAILDADGSAIVVHAMQDDYATNNDPQTGPGMSGDRIAAGTIEASEPMPATGGTSPTLLAASLLVASLLLLAGTGAFAARRSDWRGRFR